MVYNNREKVIMKIVNNCETIKIRRSACRPSYLRTKHYYALNVIGNVSYSELVKRYGDTTSTKVFRFDD